MIIDENGEYLDAVKIDNYIDANNDNIVASGAVVSNNGIYFDDIYIDNTFSRVEIGDASTYVNCTKRFMQIPTEWTDGTVKASLNKGNLVEGTLAYIYVIDSNGEVNPKGYPVIISDKPIIRLVK
jgi:hypothetical protein